jgi:tRNA pseudouridine38-40 synthase
VASFEYAGELPEGLERRLNGVAPRDIAVLAAEPAPDGFDARRDARSRTYCYRLLASLIRDPFEEGRALHWPHRVDFEKLERCAAALVGTHDFTAFTPTDSEHVRFERDILRAGWRSRESVLEFWVEADAFMRHMVRVLVGTMLEVAGGRRGHHDFVALLERAPRSAAGETAPPHGLYLASVSY